MHGLFQTMDYPKLVKHSTQQLIQNLNLKGTRATQSKEKSSGITNRYHLLANITYCMYL